MRDSVIQFISAMIVSWLFMYLLPVTFIFKVYIPFSFFLLFWVVVLGVIGRGWPLAPPEGIWKPGMSKFVPGMGMTLLWVGLAVISALFVVYVFPKIPLFPVTLNFGILLFMTTLWYALSWGAWPVARKSGSLNFFFGAAVILVITYILWFALADLSGTPFAKAPFNPQGLFKVDWLFGLAVWVIVWVQVFGGALTFQSYPFYRLGQPLGQIVLTLIAAILGYISWTWTLTFLSPTFSFAAVAGSIIGWTLFHSVVFGFYPNAKYIQPRRGFYNIFVELVLVIIWIPLLRLILAPILAKAVEAGLPFDINAISVFFTLHVLAPVCLVHNFFWLRTPLDPPPAPLGPEQLPPESISA